MKRILLLLAASLALFACMKAAPEQVEPVTDDDGPVTKKVFCPKCGAVYFVTCKKPGGNWTIAFSENTPDWRSQSTPTSYWEVKNEAGNDVTFKQYFSCEKIKFNCQTKDCGENMEFIINDFQTQPIDVPPLHEPDSTVALSD